MGQIKGRRIPVVSLVLLVGVAIVSIAALSSSQAFQQQSARRDVAHPLPIAAAMPGTNGAQTSSMQGQLVAQSKSAMAQSAAGANRLVDEDVSDLGATYNWLESRAKKAVTRFAGGSVAAERSIDGDLKARVADRFGNPVAEFVADRVGATATVLTLASGANRIRVQSRPNLTHTLEWANLQTYDLWQQRVTETTELEWRGRFIRPRGSKMDSPEDQVHEVQLEFDNGVVATTTRNTTDMKIGPVVRRPSYVTRVVANGAEVGVMRWYEREKVLAWDFPGLTKDIINEQVLKPAGGWTFRPTMAWASVQGFAFFEFHSRMKAQGSVGRTCRPEPAGKSLLAFFVPALRANDEGCDSLHWADGSVYRPCCDQHDRCYEQNGCASSSWWWPFGSAWQCTACNVGAVFCFVGAGQSCTERPGACLDNQNYW